MDLISWDFGLRGLGVQGFSTVLVYAFSLSAFWFPLQYSDALFMLGSPRHI